MPPIFGVRRNSATDDGRSAGGKIVNNRRTPSSSPYARPQPQVPAPTSSPNLNWLSSFISPARAIASNFISTVFAPDASSSSSSSGAYSDSEYEDDVSLADDDERNKGESMRLIQQLVMQETFSRDECDEMIKLIQSRVVKGYESISDSDACTTAVMEARKWLEDKKYGSGSKFNMDDQMCETNQGFLLSLVSESETGSPAERAKTYMHARPSWLSPSLKRVEFRHASPMGKYKEEISRSIFQSPLQLSEKKRSSLSAGSWNILEEIHKVRAKASEELLITTPSKKTALTSFSPENMSRHVPLTISMNEALPIKQKILNSEQPSLDLATTNCSGLPEYVGMEHGRLVIEAAQTNNVLAQSHDEETIQAIQSADAINGSQKTNEMSDSRKPAARHVLSLSAADQTSEPWDKKMTGSIYAGGDKVDRDISNVKLEHEAEPSNAAYATDSDSLWTGSQNSSSAQYEDQLKDPTQSNPKRKSKITQPGKQTRKYSRRGRGRGRRSNGSS